MFRTSAGFLRPFLSSAAFEANSATHDRWSVRLMDTARAAMGLQIANVTPGSDLVSEEAYRLANLAHRHTTEGVDLLNSIDLVSVLFGHIILIHLAYGQARTDTAHRMLSVASLLCFLHRLYRLDEPARSRFLNISDQVEQDLRTAWWGLCVVNAILSASTRPNVKGAMIDMIQMSCVESPADFARVSPGSACRQEACTYH